VRELPELFEVSVKARSLAYLYVLGAILGLLTLALPHADEVRDGPIAIVAGIALSIGVGVYLRAERIEEWQLHGVLALATVLVGLANYYAGTTVLYSILFTWGALYAFYFFELRAALVQLALVGIAYAVVLASQDPESPAILWLLAVGTPAVFGLLISRLLDRLRAEAASAEQRARALRQSESRTRLVLDSAPDAFVAIDRGGAVTSWNTAAERLFGWSAPEAVGQPLRDLIFPEDGRAAHDERRRDLLAAPEPVKVLRIETELRRRDGTTFPAEKTISRVRIGDQVMLSAFVRDLTERRRRQEESEALLREQAARAEAERITEMLSGIQVLVDAALAHRRIGDILADLVERVRGVLAADGATIFLADEGQQLRIRASSGGLPGESQSEPIPFGEGFAGRIAASRQPTVIHDPARKDIEDPSLHSLDIDSLIGVPLLAEGEVMGVLVAGAAAPRRFMAEDLGLLRLAADRVALAIDHARVYDREHRIAETLQRSLLPERLPRLAGMDAAARYLPAATEAEKVGGDWYDVIQIPGGGVGMVMGDVAGKGVAAASMVGRLRNALRAYALDGHEPVEAVEKLNRLVWNEGQDSQMATLIYVVLDPVEGVLRWVNAGHVPPLVTVGQEPPHFLEGGRSVPLGVLPFPSFEEVSVEMETGGAVVLYTDGLVERPGDHIDAGMSRLRQVVREAPVESEQLCDYVLHALVPDGGLNDDVALLTLRTLPMGASFEVEFPTVPESLAPMRGLLRRWLRHVGASDQEAAEVVTACGEAATNAIEHAGAAGETPFEVAGRLRGGRVTITIRDRGAWRPPRSGDQGRGLSLMRALMDGVRVSPGPDGTTVRLRRTLAGAKEAW
jgi:PAS domain S-box-containing protein